MAINYLKILSADATALMRRINAIEDFNVPGGTTHYLAPRAYGDSKIWGDLTDGGLHRVASANPITGTIDISEVQPSVYNRRLFGKTQDTLFSEPYKADYANPMVWSLMPSLTSWGEITVNLGVIGYGGFIFALAINPASETFSGLYIFKFDYTLNKVGSVLVVVGAFAVDNFLVHDNEVVLHYASGGPLIARTYTIDIGLTSGSIVTDTQRRAMIRGGLFTFMSPLDDGTFIGFSSTVVHVGYNGDIIHAFPSVGNIVFTDGTDIIIANLDTARTYTLTGTLIRTVVFSTTQVGSTPYPQSTFFRYPDAGAITNPESLGTPDGGATVPALTALKFLTNGDIHRTHSQECIDMRNALEAVAPFYINATSGNAFTLSAGADNIFRVAIGGQDGWTNAVDRMHESNFTDIDLVLIKLEASAHA